MYAALFVIVALVGITIVVFQTKRERKNQKNAAEQYVVSIFSEQSYRPEITTGSSYGIPTFSLKFKTDEEKQHAITNGLTDQFLRKIQDLCGHLRPRGEKFEANLAVHFYSVEDEKRWVQRAASYSTEGKQ